MSPTSNAPAVRSLRRLAGARPEARPPSRSRTPSERCDLCGNELPADHRHLLQLDERLIVCACEPCLALRSGEGGYRPTGNRRVLLRRFELPDELWASFQIPVGLAFFLVNGREGKIVALYPSPAGATESELDLGAWMELETSNPGALDLEPDVEALVVNRLSEPPQYAIVPIDECYRLVGLIKSSWEGISGGNAVERSVSAFFGGLETTP